MRHLLFHGPLVLFLAIWASLSAASEEWHTKPDQWREARRFHRSFDPAFADRIRVERELETVSPQQKTPSPNRAYWFARGDPDFAEQGPWQTVVTIFNEREYTLRLSLLDHGNTHPKLSWINEKLLYVEVWWGRVLGSVLIFDVEREAVIHREMVHWGGLAFQQWRAGGKKDSGPKRSPLPKQ